MVIGDSVIVRLKLTKGELDVISDALTEDKKDWKNALRRANAGDTSYDKEEAIRVISIIDSLNEKFYHALYD
jgi:hypothetical protein